MFLWVRGVNTLIATKPGTVNAPFKAGEATTSEGRVQTKNEKLKK